MMAARPLFLGGQWRRTDTTLRVSNPATGEVFSEVCTVSRADVAQAITDAHCMSEETFAPVAPVCPFDTEEEAVRRANASPFGLSAYVFTRDVSRTFRLLESLEAGTLGINDAVPSTSQCPFGGVKQSGWGRELGSEGLEAFLETKHASLGL